MNAMCVLWGQAVEGRLLRIEERLDCVETVAARLNHAEGKNASQTNMKHDLNTLQSRIVLLENRMVISENKVSTSYCSCFLLLFLFRYLNGFDL